MKEKRFFLLFFVLLLIALGFNFGQEIGFSLNHQQKIQAIKNLSGRFDPNEKKAIFNNRFVSPPTRQFALRPRRTVLSATSPKEKWIEVDLTHQRLKAHEGDRIVYDFPISSGKPWTPTVTGEFRIWIKLRYAKMSGGSRALGTYYYLPNVPFIMYFYRDYGLHGTYWHHNFGHPMSHGCVNLMTADAEKLFYWTDPQIAPGQNVVYADRDNPGTRVVIHGITPLR